MLKKSTKNAGYLFRFSELNSRNTEKICNRSVIPDTEKIVLDYKSA